MMILKMVRKMNSHAAARILSCGSLYIQFSIEYIEYYFIAEITHLFEVYCLRTTTYLSEIPQIKKYAVIISIYHRIFAVNTKLVYRSSTKNKVCNSGISIFNSGIEHHTIFTKNNHQIDLPMIQF